MRFLKQSTSVDIPIGPFLDSTDAITAETALTITQPDIRLKKNGAAWGQKNAAQTLTHEENGYYEVTLDATDTNTLGQLRLAVHETGAMPVWEDFMVMPANVWDSFFGASLLTTDVSTLATAANLAILDDFVDTEVAAIKAKTDQLAFTSANKVDASILLAGDFAQGAADKVWATAARTLTSLGNGLVDEILKRDFSAVTGESARSMLNALRSLRNKVSLSAGTITVTKEDDTTAAWTAAVTTDAAAEPIITSDPT